MKKIFIAVFLLFSFSSVRAEQVIYETASLYYNAATPKFNVIWALEFFTLDAEVMLYSTEYYNVNGFHVYKTDEAPVIKVGDNRTKKLITEEQLKTIQKIMYWGRYLEDNHLYWKCAVQIKIWEVLYPEDDFFLSNVLGTKLNYIDDYLEKINHFLNNNFMEIENLILPLNQEKTININLDDFQISTSPGLEYTYQEQTLTLKALDETASITLIKKYDETKPQIVYKNNMDQYYLKETDNIEFNETYLLRTVTDDSLEKEIIENPKTGGQLFKTIFILCPLLTFLFIPIFIVILIKNRK